MKSFKMMEPVKKRLKGDLRTEITPKVGSSGIAWWVHHTQHTDLFFFSFSFLQLTLSATPISMGHTWATEGQSLTNCGLQTREHALKSFRLCQISELLCLLSSLSVPQLHLTTVA